MRSVVLGAGMRSPVALETLKAVTACRGVDRGC